MNKVIAVDVDLTVVDTDFEWYKDLVGPLEEDSPQLMFRRFKNAHTDHNGGYFNPSISYELSSIVGKKGDFSFWDRPDLYDELIPKPHAIEVLRILKSAGYQIIFVSKIFAGHYNSKVRFINKFFPFHDGIIATDSKHHIKCDYIIDDRMDNMAKAGHAVRLVYNTQYDQGEYNALYREIVNARVEKLRIGNYVMVKDWQDICNLILTGRV